jgi:hypothetical protein
VDPQEEVHWCEVRWHGRPRQWPAPSNPAIVVSGSEMLILKRISFPLSMRQQQHGIFWALTAVSAATLSAVYRGQWPYVWTSALNWYEIQQCFRVLQWLCFISNLRPKLTVRSNARTHLWHIVRCLIFVGPQSGRTCCMATLWCLEFWSTV